MNDFDMEERAKNKPEDVANSIKMQWDSPAFDGKTLLLEPFHQLVSLFVLYIMLQYYDHW